MGGLLSRRRCGFQSDEHWLGTLWYMGDVFVAWTETARRDAGCRLARRLVAFGLIVTGVGLVSPGVVAASGGCATSTATCWLQRGPVVSPPARMSGVMGDDAASGRVVLFGGDPASGGTSLADTWTWDGTAWTQQHPALSPPGRDTAVMATEPVSGHVVLFGGFDGTSRLADTWTWDGTTWTQQHPPSSPPARDVAVMAADPLNSHALLFGGGNSGGVLADTWTWDGSTWTQQHPATSPPGRVDAVMAADPAAADLVLFGGQTQGGSIVADTWTWDGTTWTQQAPPISPTGRQSAQMATDPNGRVVLFGGLDTDPQHHAIFLADTWSITPSLAITPNTGPKGAGVAILGVGYSSGATATAKYTTAATKTVICQATVASDATFTCTGTIPTGPAGGPKGAHDIVGKDTTGIKAHTTFTRT
jgi:hypothetical protein